MRSASCDRAEAAPGYARPVKLSIVRGGGIGPTTRTELDAEHLDAANTAAFHDKLREAETAARTNPQPADELPDELRYELTLEDERGPRSLRYTDSNLPEPVRALITFADAQPASRTSIES
jgi:hypothetical protein